MVDERPRDGLGRPLPREADPSQAVPGVPPRQQISDEEAWAAALAYLDNDMPFHAHEVFEMRWRQAPEPDRAAWQALAQWGAALTHRARGNPVGARRVAARAALVLAQAPHIPSCIDVDRVTSSCGQLMRDSSD